MDSRAGAAPVMTTLSDAITMHQPQLEAEGRSSGRTPIEAVARSILAADRTSRHVARPAHAPERRSATPAMPPTINVRLARLQSAATLAAGKCLGGNEVKSSDVMAIAEAWERWILKGG
jgi:hypothetical protein